MDKVSYLAFCVLLFVAINNDVSGKPQTFLVHNFGGRIVGGENYTIQEAPYQVYLLLLIGVQYYQCGGSIISKKAVLTAAHCLTGVSTVTVRAGSTYANSGGTQYMSSIYMIHPQYDPVSSDYDFGIIKILTGMTIDNVNTKIVPLPNDGDQVPAGSNVTVTGWGNTMESGSVSENLMGVVVPVVSTPDCRKVYGEDDITDRMFCAGVPEGGKDSCQGDSGGPAVNDDGVQVGVVSFGDGCARPGVPGVYSNISSVRSWIKLTAGV